MYGRPPGSNPWDGFRNGAIDNRPLKFEEFENPWTNGVSAPGDYELKM
jgi:excinuclease UvrABC helicase subunit UvrB